MTSLAPEVDREVSNTEDDILRIHGIIPCFGFSVALLVYHELRIVTVFCLYMENKIT